MKKLIQAIEMDEQVAEAIKAFNVAFEIAKVFPTKANLDETERLGKIAADLQIKQEKLLDESLLELKLIREHVTKN